MQTALIAINKPDPLPRIIQDIAVIQATAKALARALPEFGYEPLLITNEASIEIDKNRHFHINRPCNLIEQFKLWRWQKKHADLLIIALGEPSLKLALRFKNAGKNRKLALYLPLDISDQIKPLQLAGVDLCICGSSFVAQKAQEILSTAKLAAAKAKFVILSPGLDIDAYQPSIPWREGARFIFAMGESLKPESGALLIARAMAALWQQKDIPAWEMRMFGAGPSFEMILNEAQHMGVSSRLSLLGDQPLNEVCQPCHVWLAPGSSVNESPATLWSGFAAGLPVIASNTVLHKERLLDEKSALIVSPENPQETAGAMLELMRNGEARATLSKRSQELKPEISLASMARRICVALSKLMSEENQNSPQELNPEQHQESSKLN